MGANVVFLSPKWEWRTNPTSVSPRLPTPFIFLPFFSTRKVTFAPMAYLSTVVHWGKGGEGVDKGVCFEAARSLWDSYDSGWKVGPLACRFFPGIYFAGLYF